MNNTCVVAKQFVEWWWIISSQNFIQKSMDPGEIWLTYHPHQTHDDIDDRIKLLTSLNPGSENIM